MSTSDLPPVVDLAAEPLAWEVDRLADPAARRAWATSMNALVRHQSPPSGPLWITVPTVWGNPRRNRLLSVLHGCERAIVLVPRAIAIAHSHTDVACSTCVVVESGSPRRPSHTSNLFAHRLIRRSDGWELVSTKPVDSQSDTWPGGDYDDASMILLDENAFDTLQWIRHRTGVGRILAVDTGLVNRYGGDPGQAEYQQGETPCLGDVGVPVGQRRRRMLAMVTVVAVIAAVVIVGGVRSGRTSSSGAESAHVGRVTIEIPSGWRRAELSTEKDATSRAVFVHRDTGRRIIVVQTALRAGSTQQTVARSLTNKIAQRGDDAVAEFAPSMRVAGREVIAYREAPESGASISWYVLVEHDLQVSIGCQVGADASAMTGECAAAVGSVVID